MLSSDGSDETKLLSAQMIGVPMLKHNTTSFFMNLAEPIETFLESLLRDSNHGTKSNCEMLQIVDMILEHTKPEDLVEHKKNLLKFVWGVLKQNDPSTKCYAYLAVARFISAFDTPAKVILPWAAADRP